MNIADKLRQALKDGLEQAHDKYERSGIRKAYKEGRRSSIMTRGGPVLTGERLRKTLQCCPKKRYPKEPGAIGTAQTVRVR